MNKIYTKTGDRGTTGTFRGRMAKDDQLAQALGAVDELKKIQSNLLIIGSQLAGSEKRIKSSEITHLEKLIDKLTKDLPKLSNFIFPMGYLQVARAVCRRAERETVAALNAQPSAHNKNILKYLNRLSDALFTMGRWVNLTLLRQGSGGAKEEVWNGFDDYRLGIGAESINNSQRPGA